MKARKIKPLDPDIKSAVEPLTKIVLLGLQRLIDEQNSRDVNMLAMIEDHEFAILAADEFNRNTAWGL